MIETRTNGGGRVVATFRLDHVANANRIAVVGDFNGWSTSATEMVHDGETFVAEVTLEPGTAYRFRYLVDGERWQNDWAADHYAPNEFGGDDSVLDLTVPRR